MFRRLVVIMLLFFVVFGIVGCGGPSTSATPTPTVDTQTTPTAAPLHIKSVITSVTPNTLSGVSCGRFMRQKWRFYESSDKNVRIGKLNAILPPLRCPRSACATARRRIPQVSAPSSNQDFACIVNK